LNHRLVILVEYINKRRTKSMPRKAIDEKSILEELRQIPEDRWGEVLTFIRSLQAGREPSEAGRPVLSGADLNDSDLIGVWADRTDIPDSREFARQLRHRAENRRGMPDAAGH
jgi:hypothetical protein